MDSLCSLHPLFHPPYPALLFLCPSRLYPPPPTHTHVCTAAIDEAEDAIVDALVKAGPTPRQQFILIRWAQKAAGALVGLATAAFLLFYQWVIEPAAPNSLRVKAWAHLTNVRGWLVLTNAGWVGLGWVRACVNSDCMTRLADRAGKRSPASCMLLR